MSLKRYTKPCMFTWFTGNMVSVIRENMRSELLEDLQLEEEKYTQSKSESLNALVKHYVTFQKQDILQFVSDLEECVHEQQNEISKATIGLGKWSLHHITVTLDKMQVAGSNQWINQIGCLYCISHHHFISQPGEKLVPHQYRREIGTPSTLH